MAAHTTKCRSFIRILCHRDMNATWQRLYGLIAAHAWLLRLTHLPLYICSQWSPYSLPHCLLFQSRHPSNSHGGAKTTPELQAVGSGIDAAERQVFFMFSPRRPAEMIAIRILSS